MVGWLRRLCGGLVAEAMWWVAGEIGNKAISASNLVEVEVEVEAELGKRKHLMKMSPTSGGYEG